MKKPALYWKSTSDGVKCTLCPHNCLLREGIESPCKTRVVSNGKLFTIAYGNPIAFNIDPVEKKPLYHFMPGHRTFSLATAGCNLHCLNCQNASISQSSPSKEPVTMHPADVVRIAKEAHCKSISLTYTEPIAYFEYALDIAKLAKQHDLPIILVSSGYINLEPLKELIPYITAANIDLKAMSNQFYRQQCGASVEPVLQAILQLHQSNVFLELTNLLIPKLNDTPDQIRKLCEWLVQNNMNEVPLHFSRFFPHFKLTDVNPTPEETMLNAIEIAQKNKLKYVYLGNMNHSLHSSTYCPQCNSELIKRKVYNVSIRADFKKRCPQCNYLIKGMW